MNTVQLKSFMAVAETLSFAKAAEIMNITQPAVTQQIKTLEDEIGAKLFRRSTRSVEMTSEGIIFMQDAQSILEIARRAENRFKTPSEEIRKELRIGFHTASEILLMKPVIAGLHHAFPNLYPTFKVNPFRHLYKQLEDGDLDAVVSFKEYVPNLRIEYKEISQVEIVAILPENHRFADKSCIVAEELKGERMIFLDPHVAPGGFNKAQQQIADSLNDFSNFFFSSFPESSLVFVQAGYGIAILPDINIDDSFIKVPIKSFVLSFGVYTRCEQLSPELKKFVEDIKVY